MNDDRVLSLGFYANIDNSACLSIYNFVYTGCSKEIVPIRGSS